MTGETRVRGQLLYPLVYVASLTLVALSSTSLAVLGRDHVVEAAMDVALGDDRTIVRGFVESNLTAADLEGGLVLPDRRAAIEPLLADLVDRYGYRDIALVPSRKDDALDATSEGRSGVAIDARTIDALSRGSADTVCTLWQSRHHAPWASDMLLPLRVTTGRRRTAHSLRAAPPG